MGSSGSAPRGLGPLGPPRAARAGPTGLWEGGARPLRPWVLSHLEWTFSPCQPHWWSLAGWTGGVQEPEEGGERGEGVTPWGGAAVERARRGEWASTQETASKAAGGEAPNCAVRYRIDHTHVLVIS